MDQETTNIPAEQEIAEQVTDAIIVEDTQEEKVDEWAPEYKIKVLDNEYEIPDYIRPYITKDNYNEIKETYEKAYALDHFKEKNNRYKEENSSLVPYKEKFEKQNEVLSRFGNYLNKKDYTNIFKELNIPDEEILKYSYDRIQYNELPPEQKKEYDSNIETRTKLSQLERQNQEFQHMLSQQTAQARANELEQCLNQDQIKDVVAQYDSRVGQPGAFKQEVIKRGQLAWYTQNKDIPANEAVREVLNLVGFNATSTEQASSVGGGAAHATPVMANTQRPIIPRINAGGSSPARKLPKSLEDLKRAADMIPGNYSQE